MSDLRMAVATAIGTLSVLPNAPATDERVAVTARAWMAVTDGQGFEPVDVGDATVSLLKKAKFFPSPAEFLESCRAAHWSRPRPELAFRPAPELPSKPTPLQMRPDREEFERLRKDAYRRLGIGPEDLDNSRHSSTI